VTQNGAKPKSQTSRKLKVNKMKKVNLLINFLFAVGLSTSYAQTVNDKPIKEIDVEFVQIVGTSKLLSNKLTIEIDFGQENKFWNADDTQVKDENGKLMVFNSMIDALNFMSKNGYNFINAYTITIGNQNVYHYLLQKRNS
jgi:hypothetical protein